MSRILIILLLVLPLFSRGQNQYDSIVHDTLPDFWNRKYYIHIGNYSNRIIESGNHTLYVGLTYKNKTQYNYEYFRINDSTFHCIEYYPSGNKKSWGNYKLTNNIIWTDSVYGFDPTIDKTTLYAYHLRQLLKSGEWNYQSDVSTLFDLGDSWQGIYTNGIRTGLWRHYINGPNNDLELELTNYSLDSSKNLSINNLINSVNIDNLNSLIIGRWRLSTCESGEPYRMLLYKCDKRGNNYGDDCNDRFGKANYYDFKSKKLFQRQRGEGCYNYKEEFVLGNWFLEKSQNDVILTIINEAGAVQYKLKLLYLDKNGNLVTERH